MGKSVREPVLEDHPDRLVRIGDRWMRDVVAYLPQDWVSKIKLGYMCLNCFHDFAATGHGAYPEKCPSCGYSPAEDQARDVQSQLKGEVLIGPKGTLDEQYEQRREELERKQYAEGLGIWTP